MMEVSSLSPCDHDRKYTLEEVVRLASEVAIEKFRKLEEDKCEKNREKARKNTRRLLKGYNELKEHCEYAVASVENSVPSDLQIVLNEVFNRRGLLKVEAIAASKRRTELIIEHIDSMLAVYKAQCEHRNVPYFDVLIEYYVHGVSVEDLAVSKAVSERTVYNYLERAENDVSILLWGVQAA